MKRMNSHLFRSLARTLACALPASLIAGCSVEPAADEAFSESAAALGVEVVSCSQAASSGYNNTSQNLAITMGSVTSVVFGVVNGYVTVNGYPCVKGTAAGGAKLTPSTVKKVSIVGTAGDDKVVIDTLTGSLGGMVASTAGITVDLAGQTVADAISIRGSNTADKWSAGKDVSGNLYFEISGDAFADVLVKSPETVAISLSAGADTFTAQGGAISAAHLTTGVTTLTAVALALTVNGGDGDDVITGGAGADIVNGGLGNDWFKASAADGDDEFHGGGGTDKMDYSGRSANLTVAMDNTTSSGDPLLTEADIIDIDVEDLVGGSGNDTLTGNVISNHIWGGAGNDTLSGGVNGGACTSDADTLEGEAGNDTFDQGAAADCGDVMVGGAGIDTVDYQGRSANLNINLDGNALDGASGEKDNVKTDVEVVISGSGDDILTGSSAGDTFHGGPGNDTLNGGSGNDSLIGNSGTDTLNGEAGNDTFIEGGVDAVYTVAENCGDDADILNGGTHDAFGVDTADYSARTAAVLASICIDPTKLTGGPTGSLTGNCSDSDGEAAEGDKIVNITRLVGGMAGDTLKGSTTDDIIEGGAGDDTIYGGAGNDLIYGDADDDTLYGEAGDDNLDSGAHTTALDTLDGGAGDGDVCAYDATTDSFTGCEL